MTQPRISYVPMDRMDDAMRAEMARCAQFGTPRPESSAVRAHVPACFWSFANAWQGIFRDGVLDHTLKELCRLYVSRSVKCEFCGNQRSIAAVEAGMREAQVDELIDFERSARYGAREKAALAYAEAITWRLTVDDAFWARMHAHFSEPELVELGCFVALTMGQQSWLRLLDIDHHQVMAGTAASMAPGFESAQATARSKTAPDYWARQPAAPAKRGS